MIRKYVHSLSSNLVTDYIGWNTNSVILLTINSYKTLITLSTSVCVYVCVYLWVPDSQHAHVYLCTNVCTCMFRCDYSDFLTIKQATFFLHLTTKVFAIVICIVNFEMFILQLHTTDIFGQNQPGVRYLFTSTELHFN